MSYYRPEPPVSRWAELPGDPMPLRRELAERRAKQQAQEQQPVDAEDGNPQP